MKRLLSILIAACAMTFVTVPAAEAVPVRTAQVRVEGSEIHYSAGMSMTLTGWGGSWAFVNGTWGLGTYDGSITGRCLLPIATNVSYDPETEILTFDCFALGFLMHSPGGPFGTQSYMAWALGNVRVNAGPTTWTGASVTALGTPFTIGFPVNPSGWNWLWGNQSLACMNPMTPCSMTVT